MCRRVMLLPLLAVIWSAIPVVAQSSPTDYRDEFLVHFEQSSRKVLALAETVPQDLYGWSPAEGVMTISEVYMHIARYNFMYLEEQLGIDAPHDIDYADLESVDDKHVVTEMVQRSIVHVRNSISNVSEETMTAITTLYGRDVTGWAVLFQLLAHMNEHVGQSVSYVRMNGITPPWST